MRLSLLSVCVLLASAPVSVTGAQPLLSDVIAGVRVRVKPTVLTPKWLVANVDSVSRDSIYVTPVDRSYMPLGVARSSLSAIDVKVGEQSRVDNTFKGMGWGILIGAVTGGIIGYVGERGEPSGSDFYLTPAQSGELLGVVGAVGGLVIGGIVGAAQNPGTLWHRVYPITGMGLSPTR